MFIHPHLSAEIHRLGHVDQKTEEEDQQDNENRDEETSHGRLDLVSRNT
jgi:hypothetical protein